MKAAEVNCTQNESDRSDGDDGDGEQENSSWMEIVVKEQVPLVSQQQNLRKYLEKRKFLEQSSVPKLIGNTPRHLERQLSAAKRDALIIQEKTMQIFI